MTWVRFLRAHAALTRELGARLEAEHGLTMSDFDVLIQLYHAPEHAMRRIDISRQVLLTPPGSRGCSTVSNAAASSRRSRAKATRA